MRVKGGPKTRHRRNRVFKRAKGFFGARRKLYGVAKETLDRADAFAFVGRKLKKRQYRRLWITRINAAARLEDISYSRLIAGLSKASIEIDRKALADLAMNDPAAFKAVVSTAKQALA